MVIYMEVLSLLTFVSVLGMEMIIFAAFLLIKLYRFLNKYPTVQVILLRSKE